MRTFPSGGGGEVAITQFRRWEDATEAQRSHLQRGARRWVRTHSPFTVGLILFLSSFIHISFSTPLASFPAERHISQNIYQLCLKKYVLVLLLWISLVLVFFFFVLIPSSCFARRHLRSGAEEQCSTCHNTHATCLCVCMCVCVHYH